MNLGDLERTAAIVLGVAAAIIDALVRHHRYRTMVDAAQRIADELERLVLHLDDVPAPAPFDQDQGELEG